MTSTSKRSPDSGVEPDGRSDEPRKRSKLQGDQSQPSTTGQEQVHPEYVTFLLPLSANVFNCTVSHY
eukprot:jgi/Chrzof1/5622/Cz16g09090.t1